MMTFGTGVNLFFFPYGTYRNYEGNAWILFFLSFFHSFLFPLLLTMLSIEGQIYSVFRVRSTLS